MLNQVTALIIALQATTINVSKERLSSISTDMVAVVDSAYADSTIKSSLPKEDALALLGAVAVHESGLRESVEACKIAGDAGKSVGLTQVMQGFAWDGFSRKEICASRSLQLKLGLRVLDMCWAKKPDPEKTLRCYASGDYRIKSWAALSEFALFKKISKIMKENFKNTGEST